MSKTYAIVRLLQHGPLTLKQIVDIGGAGWNAADISVVLWRLQRTRRITRHGCYAGAFKLTGSVDDALRGLLGCEPWRCSPAGVESLQPGLHGLRRPADLQHPPAQEHSRRPAQRAHVSGREGLGRMGARGAGAANAGDAHVAGLVGVGP